MPSDDLDPVAPGAAVSAFVAFESGDPIAAAIRAYLKALWRPIEEAPKRSRSEGMVPVLLAGHYPSNKQPTDIIESWWNPHDEEWARWTHAFPPTYFMLRPHPPEPSDDR